jgi:hypothetical protein
VGERSGYCAWNQVTPTIFGCAQLLEGANTMIRTIAATVALGLVVCACGPQRPAIDPQLESGITSSNGGGTRELGNIPNVAIGPNGEAQTQSPNTRGPAY